MKLQSILVLSVVFGVAFADRAFAQRSDDALLDGATRSIAIDELIKRLNSTYAFPCVEKGD